MTTPESFIADVKRKLALGTALFAKLMTGKDGEIMPHPFDEVHWPIYTHIQSFLQGTHLRMPMRCENQESVINFYFPKAGVPSRYDPRRNPKSNHVLPFFFVAY